MSIMLNNFKIIHFQMKIKNKKVKKIKMKNLMN